MGIKRLSLNSVRQGLNVYRRFSDSRWIKPYFQQIASFPATSYSIQRNSAMSGQYVFSLDMGQNTNGIYVYDTVSNTYTLGASKPANRSDFAFAAHNEQAYLIGGWTGSGYINTVYRYNRSNNTWSSIANYPISMNGFGAVGHSDGHVYAVSSWGGGDCYRYNVSSNSWSGIANTGNARSYMYPTRVGSDLFVCVGSFSHTIGYTGNNHVLHYKPSTNTWTWPNSISAPSNGAYAGTGTAMYIMFGANMNKYDPNTYTFTLSKVMPTNMNNSGGAGEGRSDGIIYFTNGTSGASYRVVGE